MKRLIVNADDFGLHPSVNEGIIEGFKNGLITSTSLIAPGRAAEEAARLARENPALGVGVHLTLVAERPVLPPGEVPSLIGENGGFLPDHVAFVKRYIGGGINMRELIAECGAQINRVKELGISPTHIDSHQHLHVLPGAAGRIAELAKRHGIKKVRLPAEPCLFSGGYDAPLFRRCAKCALTLCARMARGAFDAAGLSYPAHFFGMLAGGNIIPENLLAILRALPDGASEIMIHPGRDNAELDSVFGWGYHWEEELSAATSPAAAELLEAESVETISFGEL